MRAAVAFLAVMEVFLAVPGSAEPLPGVRFDLMPVGCRIHGTFNDGQRVVEEYLGPKGKTHVMRTRAVPSGRLIRTTTYDGQGFMTRKDWADGKWESFTPFSCFDRPGACRYTYRNADGAQLEYRGKVVRRGKKIVSSGAFKGEPPFPDSVVTPGPFNNGERFTEGDTSFRVTRYENCGEVRPAS